MIGRLEGKAKKKIRDMLEKGWKVGRWQKNQDMLGKWLDAWVVPI